MTYPGVLLGALLWGHILLKRGGDHALVITGVTAAVAAIVLILQRLLPYEQDWRGWRQDLRVDLTHAVLSSWAVPALFKGLAFGLLFTMADGLSRAMGGSLWPHGWDILPQLGLALIIGELGNYWAHRLMHETRLGWRFHSIHHTSERLYLLSSARSHPFNVLAIYMSQTVPLIVLGAQGEVLALFTLFTSVNGMLQHANIDMRQHGLNWLVASADLHRFHHSTVIAEGNSNYGGNLIIWDIVFGTRYLPDRRQGPERVGISDEYLPERFWGQLLVPFAWRKMVRPREPAEAPAPAK